MKKIILIISVLILMAGLIPASIGGNNPTITIMAGNSSKNLTQVNFAQGELPFISNDSTMISLRSISEIYKTTISWDQSLMKATITRDDLTIVMVIGDKKITKIENEKQKIINISTAPILQNGRVFVPLRFVSESFGSKVDWDSKTYIVSIIDVNITSISAPATYGGNIVVNSADTDIKLIFKCSDAGYNNVFGIYSPIKRDLGTGHNTPNGTEFNLGKFPTGTELIFFIRNPNGNVFLNGVRSRNSDNLVHAKFQNLAVNSWYLGFEDTLGGGDQDCNDVELNIIGTVSDIPIPEPTPTIEPTPIPTPIYGTPILNSHIFYQSENNYKTVKINTTLPKFTKEVRLVVTDFGNRSDKRKFNITLANPTSQDITVNYNLNIPYPYLNSYDDWILHVECTSNDELGNVVRVSNTKYKLAIDVQ